MEDEPTFSPSLDALATIFDGLESMNNYIDFNPFTVKRQAVDAYIKGNSSAQGVANEAA